MSLKAVTPFIYTQNSFLCWLFSPSFYDFTALFYCFLLINKTAIFFWKENFCFITSSKKRGKKRTFLCRGQVEIFISNNKLPHTFTRFLSDGQFSFSISINLSGGRTLEVKETVKVLYNLSRFFLSFSFSLSISSACWMFLFQYFMNSLS